MEFCKFQKEAVCTDAKYRNFFKMVFKKLYPEIKICSKASYKITKYNGKYFIISNLDHIKEGEKGFYILDKYTGMPIYLSNKNFEILCNCNPANCDAIDHVTIYRDIKNCNKK